MLRDLLARLGRPTVLVTQGIVIGALVAGAFAGSGAEAATTYTRAVSCHGFGFEPVNDSIGYETNGTRRVPRTYGYFVCAVDLPHKAVVTRVRFTLYDTAPVGALIRNCGLVRSGLTSATSATAQVLAAVPSTTGAPGVIRLEDTTINYATVDNMNYVYYVHCEIDAYDYFNQLGIYGADITFKITAANG
jgi:hypothetical protein